MCPGGSHLACRWVSAGWGAGPRRASRHCRENTRGVTEAGLGVGAVPAGWTRTAGRCSRARLCPLEWAASPPCSQCPPCSLLFPTLGLPGCVFGAAGHFPSQLFLPSAISHLVPSRSQPQNPHSATPSPCWGPPALLPEGQRKGSSLSLHPEGAIGGPRAILSSQRDPSCRIQSSGKARRGR